VEGEEKRDTPGSVKEDRLARSAMFYEYYRAKKPCVRAAAKRKIPMVKSGFFIMTGEVLAG
jgi:hypothetical protein